MSDRIGQQLGNYRLTQLLGQGGFAEVYLGEHVYLKTQAAIKVLHAQITDESGSRESFLNEARTIAGLVHPHIVRVLDFGIEQTIPFLVMDYAPYGTLRRRHPPGNPLPLSTIVPYVKQLASALQYAHNLKLIHRDIKPENMLLGRSGEVLLSDFGIATIARTSQATKPENIAGTVFYMSPEQIQGNPRPASDQYSLGIVVYEWLTGHCPFHGSFIEVATQHLFATPPPLREKVPTLSQDVEQVVLKALHKDPHQRFVNMQAFAEALEQTAHGSKIADQYDNTFISPSNEAHTLLATPFRTPLDTPDQPVIPVPIISDMTQPANAASLPEGRNIAPTPPVNTPVGIPISPPTRTSITGTPSISRRVVIGGLIGLIAAGSGITWFALTHEQSPQTHASSLTPPPSHPTVPSHPSTSPTATTQSTTPSPTSSPTVAPLSSPFIYRGHSDKVFTAAWSPNSTRIASAGIGATVQVWDATSGNHVFIYNGQDTSSPPKIYSVAWSHDGTRIASAHEDGTVQVWNATSGIRIATCRGHSGHVNSVDWSPNDTRIVSGGHDATARVWNAASGSQLLMYSNHTNYVNAVTWSPDGNHIASASGDATVQVWNAANAQSLFTYRGHSDQVEAVKWSPDGSRLVSGSLDTTAQVWNASNGNTLRTYRGHSNWVLGVSWSPDSTRVASCSQDTTAQLWNASSGNTLATYRGHSDVVEAIAWSPVGVYIASASDDRTVQVWNAS